MNSKAKWFMLLIFAMVGMTVLYTGSFSSSISVTPSAIVRVLPTATIHLRHLLPHNDAETHIDTSKTEVKKEAGRHRHRPSQEDDLAAALPAQRTSDLSTKFRKGKSLASSSQQKLGKEASGAAASILRMRTRPALSEEHKPSLNKSANATSSDQTKPSTELDYRVMKETDITKHKRYSEKVYPDDKYHGRCYTPPATKRVTHRLTAQQIANELSAKFDITERTLQDINQAIDLNVISINQSDIHNIKIILGYHGYEHTPHYTWYNFTHCEYTNCIPLNPHRTLDHPMAPPEVAKAASVVLFNLVEMYHGSTIPKIPRRPDQYFGVTSLESTGYHFNLMPDALDGIINMTLTYHRKSTVPEWHIFKACMDRKTSPAEPQNYAAGKTRGALAYVSNCNSVQYDRLAIMKELRKYIPVDIYGTCGTPDPCISSAVKNCSANLHLKYHFYLSFENSLCEDYISEKFWDRLSEPVNMLPVAMGGLSVREYTEQAPENSFIHVRNFTSVAQLGAHLKGLMENEKQYNAYHQWREHWDVYKRPIYTRFPSCDLCRIANEMPYMPADESLSSKYNDPKHCANYDPFPSRLG